MISRADATSLSLLLPPQVAIAIMAFWEIERGHPRALGLDAFPANSSRFEALAKAKRTLRAAVSADRRPVGMAAPQEVIYVSDLLREAAEQFAYEIESAQDARQDVLRRRMLAWDGARQCATELGIRECETHAEALSELARVGLGWMIEAARRKQGTWPPAP